MDIGELKTAARILREKLESLKDKDAAAALLYRQINPLLTAAEQGNISENVEPREILDQKLFDESNLSEYSDLKKAYTNFHFELIGGREWDAYKLLEEKMSKP
ncbi:hypothetical protein EQV97_12610 [Pseudomonas sp. TMW22090]|uniref:hypothetical protein n=1 Tax=Pseudomonas sp. TMW22090 TaxID=2506434 RepID=UPI000F0975CE|nr:hypothetical protein [Pseudomonas sp. TMW22090]MCH4878225.1 hypothetical protein [Pseudomonas sp. TMW22090]